MLFIIYKVNNYFAETFAAARAKLSESEYTSDLDNTTPTSSKRPVYQPERFATEATQIKRTKISFHVDNLTKTRYITIIVFQQCGSFKTTKVNDGLFN